MEKSNVKYEVNEKYTISIIPLKICELYEQKNLL